MGDKTGIAWTDSTWNVTTGCTKVSQGCKHCYAERVSKRLAGRAGYPADNPFRLTLHPDRLLIPVRWSRPRLIFTCSMSDLFHADVPDEYIAAVFGVMATAPQHVFQVLTKRPERMASWFESLERRAHNAANVFPNDSLDWRRRHTLRAALLRYTGEGRIPAAEDAPWPLPHVWIGTSVENQAAADTRIPHLLRCPAVVRFLSCEPLLESVDLRHFLDPLGGVDAFTREMLAQGMLSGDQEDSLRRPTVQWVIAGGESGPGARPCDEDWLRGLRDQCQRHGVPFFLKQLGGFPHKRDHEQAVLDGRTWQQMPLPIGKEHAG